MCHYLSQFPIFVHARMSGSVILVVCKLFTWMLLAQGERLKPVRNASSDLLTAVISLSLFTQNIKTTVGGKAACASSTHSPEIT